MSRPKGPTDADRPTTQLAPIEVEALLHEPSGPIEVGAATIEMLPLVAIGDGDGDPEPPAPSRVARGSDAVTRSGKPVVVPARVRRTVERIAVADIRSDKKPTE